MVIGHWSLVTDLGEEQRAKGEGLNWSLVVGQALMMSH
jgi:hypothetical protein